MAGFNWKRASVKKIIEKIAARYNMPGYVAIRNTKESHTDLYDAETGVLFMSGEMNLLAHLHGPIISVYGKPWLGSMDIDTGVAHLFQVGDIDAKDL